MSRYVARELRRKVTSRAENICEYCRIPPKIPGISHQIEHILARQHGGETVAENLALACAVCNRYKGANVSSYDFETGNLTALFNPRTQDWTEHFQVLESGEIKPLTAEARVTIKILRINDAERIEERRELMEAGLYE